MNPLTAPALPSSVEVAGAEVPIRCGYRKQIALESLDLEDPVDATAALVLCYGEELPRAAADHPAEALTAAIAWHNGAWGLMSYGAAEPSGGDGGAAGGRPVFDWEADACLVAADFMREYGIDLLDPATQMHWYRFMALFLPVTRAGGLVSRAIAARSPAPPGASRAERERHRAAYSAWALPPTESELRAQAMGRF